MTTNLSSERVGWVGTGRMGLPMAERLLGAGHELVVWNRTPDRAASLVAAGATQVELPRQLTGCAVVFTMVMDDSALEAVALGPDGVLAASPQVVVDCSTVSEQVSLQMSEAARAQGAAFLSAPVSGNPEIVRSGELTFVASGPMDAYERVHPLLEAIGARIAYAGAGAEARLVKICHNALVAVTTQALSEMLVLAERRGVPRHAVMDFINGSVVGSRFTRYKSSALVDLDMTPTFTPEGLHKDLELALDAARSGNVPAPVVSATADRLRQLVDSGRGMGKDFGSLIELEAAQAGLELESYPHGQ